MQSAQPQAQCMPTTGHFGSTEAHGMQGAGLGLQCSWDPGLSCWLSSFLLVPDSPACPHAMFVHTGTHKRAHMLLSVCLCREMHVLSDLYLVPRTGLLSAQTYRSFPRPSSSLPDTTTLAESLKDESASQCLSCTENSFSPWPDKYRGRPGSEKLPTPVAEQDW